MWQIFSFAEKVVDAVIDWNSEAEIANSIPNITEKVIEQLHKVEGMTPAHSRDFKRAMPIFTLRDGTVVRMYVNPVKVHHVFLASKDGKMIFGGFVGWIHFNNLNQALEKIKAELF